MYDVHVVSMYESMSSFSHTAGTATVILRVSGPNQGAKPLVLVLVSYEPVRWSLSVPSGVTIHRVLLVRDFLLIKVTGYSFMNNKQNTLKVINSVSYKLLAVSSLLLACGCFSRLS